MRIGLGTNRLNDTPEQGAFLQAAVASGLRFIDTADAYTYGDSEKTLGKYLGSHREHITIATKGGVVRGQPLNGSPQHLRKALEQSLLRLQTDCIDLYQLHWPDPEVPFAESVGTLMEMQQAGHIREVGLCNVSVAQIQEAQSLGVIATVQNEYNLIERKHQDVLAYCEAAGLRFLPYAPLSLGERAAEVQYMAQRYQASPAQVVLAWLLQQSSVMLPIPGTLSLRHLQENLAAEQLQLSADDLAQLNAQPPLDPV